MYRISNFIDSIDVREYNKNRNFTPAEQAVLAVASEGQTVQEKINVLRELVKTYSEQEFQEGSKMIRGYIPETDRYFRELVQEQIREWEELLNEQKSKEEQNRYRAIFQEKGCNDKGGKQKIPLFDSYEEAYWYLEEKRQTVENGFGEIFQIRNRGGKEKISACFCLDEKLRLIDLWRRTNTGRKLKGFEIYVPSPFQSGELIKMESPFYETFYGLLPYRQKKPEKREEVTFYQQIYVYERRIGQIDFRVYANLLSMGRCTKETLPGDQKPLRYLQMIGKQEKLW